VKLRVTLESEGARSDIHKTGPRRVIDTRRFDQQTATRVSPDCENVRQARVLLIHVPRTLQVSVHCDCVEDKSGVNTVHDLAQELINLPYQRVMHVPCLLLRTARILSDHK